MFLRLTLVTIALAAGCGGASSPQHDAAVDAPRVDAPHADAAVDAPMHDGSTHDGSGHD